MAEVAKLHHTVPKFYLRGFAEEVRAKVWKVTTVRLPGERRYTQIIEKTAATNHFYSIDGHPDGTDSFERALSRLEGSAASVMRDIEAGTWPLPQDQRGTLGSFIAVQAVRGPDHRRSLQYIAAQMARLEVQTGGRENVQRWAKHRYGVELDEDEAETVWQDATQPTGPPITIPPVQHMGAIVDSAFKLLPYILGRPWTLYRFSRRSLFTCDSPIGLVPRPGTPSWEGVGFLTAENITVPLTRRLGLLMGNADLLIEHNVPLERVHAGSLDGEEPATTAVQKLINATTLSSSSEYVYHHPDDHHVLPTHLPEPRPSSISIAGHDSRMRSVE